jgi:dipeptidyl aminopeptidase/acylaminoacyl peptidase
LSLSPNGRLLLLTYITDDPLPADWVASRAARHLFDAGIPTPILALQNLDTDESSIALKTYLPLSLPLWNPDGRSFAVVAMSPVGSVWEHEDSATPGALGHLFAVNLQPETVDQIVSHVANNGEQPLTWTQNGTLTVHTSADTIASFSFENGRWRSTSSYRIPLDDMYRLAQLASDGKQLVGDYQNLSTPPELFQWLLGERSIKTLVRLNPEFDSLALAPSMSVQWKTSTGYDINGILLLPPGYSDKNQYPLVIQTKPYVGQFLCDTGVSHFPSFAPQPIADAGMLYLIRSYPEDINNNPDAGHLPKGYPGGVGEAVFNMDVWDSAIAALNARGIIQMDKLGIIGFSRSGWYTEYILAHSGVRYRAATVTDNIQYSIGEYWTSRGSLVQPLEGMYGGPPYGKTFANWLDYSISFNLDKVRTPLLMEQMGGGVPFVSERSIPAQLIPSLEIFMGLQRLKRPVELYYYPNEDHQPDNPQARLASLQRNVDWYRFWLQGYERPNPENPEQYIRWSALRSLH